MTHVHDAGNGRSNQEEGDFVGYDFSENKPPCSLEILWNLPGFGPIPGAHSISLWVSLYEPKRPLLDNTKSEWSNMEGYVVGTEQPPYAIRDTGSLVMFVERYFERLQPQIENHILDLVQHDPIASLTYYEVMRQRRRDSELLDLAIQIQCLSFVSQGYGTVSSNNVPGIREYDFSKLGRSTYDAYNRKSRDRPLPAAINHQMDVALLKALKKLESRFVKALTCAMLKSGIKPWYEIFLALFVLSWNLEYIRRGAEKYIMSKNGTVSARGDKRAISELILPANWNAS